VQRLEAGTATGVWRLDATRSRIEFHNKHFWGLISVHGRFDSFDGEMTVDPSGTVTGELEIDAASLDTGNKKRDQHLRSEDFFDAERHGKVILAVTAVRPSDGDGVRVGGTLTAAGRSRPIDFEALVSSASDDEVTLDATVSVDRSDFAMTWSPLRVSSLASSATVHLTFVRPRPEG
jgi:polyisoprenoid-binding protein YceI